MKRLSTGIALIFFCGSSLAASEEVKLNLVTAQNVGQEIGTVKIEETDKGLTFTPDLRALPPGQHGFHIHAKGSCEPAIVDGKAVAAGAAGGHFDPQNTGKHLGPDGNGHLGDLPVLSVNADGKATQPVTAPRLKKIDQIKGLAIMVHAGGDNMADHPKPLGGGGARFACGVIRE
ncbi:MULTISPECIES: superoxide dismutase [Cu-Zn] SodC [Tenebrionibacter/Tenebrionicola group]|jgi:Cu-Zn family superoxide dismutase|uniref:Superoxide dismutase [Cu-Zn] n=2 Tax=Tenebrionibacter/Tenebrionicola group TaxID=2969848 RepID=A0A8K0V7H4_9ENTR|nr:MULTISPECIES: superoxide dismutase [Cu-Zn] SodC [Tenebrionibacter/Tenebrionicola group]MBK4716773.1 superoxide dismutase [Cu-Zn] SodC2 [Tenebrionibacter intestinalis]MBV4413449.1 superoxide dismutase [Cu-Zn] SodC2 [Tenebrionicola larvae]MBV5096835.1 superoxide dismutase [Cu-Zn] SodC2 [Tenebrionicola larvae]